MKAIVSLCLVLILGATAFAQAKKETPKYKNLDPSKLKLEDEGYLKFENNGASLTFVVDEVIDDSTAKMGLATSRSLQFIFKVPTKNLADGSVYHAHGAWKVASKEKKGTSTLFVLEKISKK